MFEVFEHGTTLWVAMELVEGSTLRVILWQKGGLPAIEVIRCGERLADALHAAHSRVEAWWTAVNYGVGGGPYSMALGDVNGDGKPNLAVASNLSLAGTVSILLNTCAAPGLTVSKTHAGNFTQGQTGATYTITVTNAGGVPTSGTVTLTDTLPASLTATALGGSGWSCTLGTLSCTRGDGLAPSASYPAVTLTVTVASNAPTSVTNTASVAGGGEINPGNDSASDPTTVNQSGLIAPTNLVATAISTSQVGLTWDAVTPATGYQVFRSANNGPYGLVGSGLPALAYTDPALTAGDTIKAAHIQEVRSGVK